MPILFFGSTSKSYVPKNEFINPCLNLKLWDIYIIKSKNYEKGCVFFLSVLNSEATFIGCTDQNRIAIYLPKIPFKSTHRGG